MPTLSDRLAARGMATHVPLSVHVDVTMRCNERCVHCYRVVERKRAELTTEEIRDLLDQLARAGTLYLTFSGGEVFLRGDLFDLLAHARRRRFDLRLKSNALRVSAATAGRLRDLGVRQVDVSLYSADPAVHDRITCVPGSHARTLEGVARLHEAGLRVKLNCPLMSVNVGGYREIRALAERLGVLYGFDPMISARNDGDRAPVRLRVGPADLRRVMDDPLLRSTGPVPPPRPAAGAPPRDGGEIACGAGHTACYVGAYGDVTPCVAMPVVCGNIRDEPFEAIWRRSARMLEVRSIRVRDLHTCSGCAASPFCGRCPGQALVEDGDLYGPAHAACTNALAAARAAGSSAVPASMQDRQPIAAPA
jgi:radical SAM protein with 4Fe4S-binding SPASM domain